MEKYPVKLNLENHAKYTSNFLHAHIESSIAYYDINPVPILMSRDIEITTNKYKKNITQIRDYIPVRCYFDYLIMEHKSHYIPQLIKGEEEWINTL